MYVLVCVCITFRQGVPVPPPFDPTQPSHPLFENFYFVSLLFYSDFF